MGHPRTFRFAALAAFARRAEDLGFDTISLGEHIALGGLALVPVLGALAACTTRARLTTICANDFRNPALLASEAAAVALLSGGRLDLGLGAGWYGRDFEALGLPFDKGRRFARFAEAVTLIKRLLREDSVSHEGAYYTVRDLTLDPRPSQPPRLFIGGGGRRLLQLAAREADIIGLDLRGAAGLLDGASTTAEAVDEKLGWIREAAGDRFDQLELNILVHHVVVTDDMRQGLDVVRARLAYFATMSVNTDLTEAQIHASPHVLLGSLDQIVEKLRMMRERYGISYVSFLADLTDAAAPIVARLAGT
jgi:probable F420-dependent oxidoreductase